MFKKYKTMNHDEKKWFLIKFIGGLVFLLAGGIFGIVSLAMNGWSFIDFITDPTTDLIFLCLIAVGIIMLSTSEVK